MQFRFSISLFLLAIAGQVSAQKPEWQNPDATATNREPMRSSFFPFASEADANAGFDKATTVELLNGKWRFKLFANPLSLPAQFEKMRFEDDAWANFPVPCNWEFKGYGTPYLLTDARDLVSWDSTTKVLQPQPPRVPAENPTGIYRRRFLLPEQWTGKEIFLHFGGVKSAFYLYVNGRKVGYSEDSKLPAEFNITDFVRPKENTVCLVVMRYADASFLECQNFWRVSGIERDVYAFAVPKTWIRDFTVHSGLQNQYKDGKLEIDLKLKSHTSDNMPGLVEALLIDNKGKTVWQQQKPIQPTPKEETVLTNFFQATLPGVAAWSAEVPNLYRLEIRMKDAAGLVQELIRQPVGFRTAEVIDGHLLVNGRRVKLNGVTRHEHDPDDVHAVSDASMRKDIELMKQLNVNTVRTAHYPHHPRWYELCNEYGLYIIDEANLESHVENNDADKALPNRPEWRKAYVERMTRMVERDKNQPCVIAWHAAETGTNVNLGYEQIKQIDPTRLVNVGALFPDTCPMWISQGIRQYQNGKEIFGYGTPAGMPDTKADSVQNWQTMVNPDRLPNLMAAEVKKRYAPIRVRGEWGEKKVRILVTNGYAFQDMQRLSGRLTWYRNGVKVVEEKLKLKNLQPADSQWVEVKYPSPVRTEKGLEECRILVEFLQPLAGGGLPANHVVASQWIAAGPPRVAPR